MFGVVVPAERSTRMICPNLTQSIATTLDPDPWIMCAISSPSGVANSAAGMLPSIML